MDRNTLNKALTYISDQHITDAAKSKRRKPYWITVTAAATAAAILLLVMVQTTLPKPTFSVAANTARIAPSPRNIAFPLQADYETEDAFQYARENHLSLQAERRLQKEDALNGLAAFFAEGSALFLTGEENALWSPVSAYMSLASLAELSSGRSQRQILKLLGVNNTNTLRKQVSSIFESAYADKGKDVSKLATSLWLQEGISYQDDKIDALVKDYYTSVYSGILGSTETQQAITDWVNTNTGDLLSDYPPDQLTTDAVFALYSTVYFQSQWKDDFDAKFNFSDIFHSPAGDRDVTYMRNSARMTYYQGDNFGAVYLPLENGSYMWFILPDENTTAQDVLRSGQYMDMVLSQNWEDQQTVIAHLTIPKFDVAEKKSLKDGLMQLGVTDIFSADKANFSALRSELPAFAGSIQQASRVQIDEAGVTGASYTEIIYMGSTPPSDTPEPIDFILDRPFLFVVEKDNIPLFTGVVNEP